MRPAGLKKVCRPEPKKFKYAASKLCEGLELLHDVLGRDPFNQSPTLVLQTGDIPAGRERLSGRGSGFSRIVVGDSPGLQFSSGGETIFEEGRCWRWAN